MNLMTSLAPGLPERDGELGALEILLDDAALGSWVGGALGASVELRRKYLRYKHRTAMVVTADLLNGPTEVGRELVVWHWAAEGRPKLDKLVRKAPPGAVLHVDAAAGLVLAAPAADRHLPALGKPPWFGPDRAELKTLSYKPHRRWVGRIGSAGLVRVYPPGDLARFTTAARALSGTQAPVATLRGVNGSLGAAVYDWTPGSALTGTSNADELRSLGAAVARLHETPVHGEPATDRGVDLEATVAFASLLLPDLRIRLERLALRAVPKAASVATLHGDLSLDQVVRGPDRSLTLIDLDRVRRGDPAEDLGCLAASLMLDGRPNEALMAEVEAGYGSVARVPDHAAVRAWTVYHLLLRSTEAFRSCRVDWPVHVTHAIEAAERIAFGKAAS